MTRHTRRRNKGLSLVEFAAALAFGFPLVMITIYAVIEANMLFTIRTNCDAAVRRAAQVMINDYQTNGTSATSYTQAGSNKNLPSAVAFDIKTADGHYFVNKNANQFTWTWDLASTPKTITVTVKYPTTGSAGNSLLPFPYPDPLNLRNQFSIVTTGTFPVPPAS
jgi:hypothetical protein